MRILNKTLRVVRSATIVLIFAAGGAGLFAQPQDETESNGVDESIAETDDAGESAAEDETNAWRVVVGAAYGEMMLDLRTSLPYTYTDPRTGQRVLPAIGRALGLTQYGSLDLQARGLGPQTIGQFVLTNNAFTFSAAYAKVDVNFNPLQKDKLPINTVEGGASGETWFAQGEYQYENSTIFTPYLRYTFSTFRVRYDARNVVGYVPGADIYESFARIQAQDGARSHAGRTGVRIKLPIQNWYIGPYWQLASNNYAIQVKAGTGAVDTHTLLIPDNSPRLIDSWYSRGVGAAYTFDTITRTRKVDESGGLELFMDYKKFLSLKIDARRNYESAAWVVSATGLLFFHPNVGIAVTASYGEPEITRTLNRAYGIGPVATFTF